MKTILVTGGLGMIGRELVELLEKDKNNIVCVADLKDGDDLTSYEQCKTLCVGTEEVYHLVGVKGNPKMTKERPLDFMFPMLQCDTNMIRAAIECGVKKFLYTSSIAVENPESDKYPAWAKMTGETLLEAAKIQHPEFKSVIVRPANVYGRFDNFDNPNAMVVTKLINEALKNKKLILDNEGSNQYRDFINAKDVARGMILAMEEMPAYPVNLCSGDIWSINNLVLEIKENLNCKVEYADLGMTLGPRIKPMTINWNFKPQISLREGIKEVCEWVKNGNHH